MTDAAPDRIVAIDLDRSKLVRWSAEIEHERRVAVFDLLESNSFALIDGFPGPYRVVLSLQESTLLFDVRREGSDESSEIALPLRSFRRLIKDYFLICESYFRSIKDSSPSRIEAIDMGRRGLHDEGSGRLVEALKDKVRLDHDTARRLFTLVCVLHIRG